MTEANPFLLEIYGDAGLRTAQDLAIQLRQALAEHSAVTVVTDALTAIDITTLQLLVAARTTALAAGKTLALRAPRDGVLRALLLQAGFLDANGTSLTPQGDFWTKMDKAA